MVRWKRVTLFGLTFTILWLLYLKADKARRKCAEFPTVIKHTNAWQTVGTQNGALHFLSAFLDDRQSPGFFSQKYHTVRVLGMGDQPNPRTYCQIWYNTQESITVESSHFRIWNKNWKPAEKSKQPFIFSCDTPDTRIPKYVSLVANRCDMATNRLTILYKKASAKDDFVVCVKGLHYPYEDKSTRLVEWIELLTLLGANKIHFYKFSVHSNVERVLDYYQNRNNVVVTQLSNTTTFLKESKVLALNDCFYTYLYKYKYVVSLDIDEMIVPRSGAWPDLMKILRARNGVADSYLVRNIYFFDHLEHSVDDVPEYMHILRHVTRAEEFSPEGEHVKGFHDTGRVLALDDVSLWCWGWWGCENLHVGVDLAQLQHYRDDCVKELRNCEELKKRTVVDTKVRRFKEKLLARVERTLVALHFID